MSDLDPILPPGSGVRFVINTGSWEPPPLLRASGFVSEFSRTYSATDGWTVTLQGTTTNSSWALNCTTSGCEHPTSQIDRKSNTSFTVEGFPKLTQPGCVFSGIDICAFRASMTGWWVASNAASFVYPQFDFFDHRIYFAVASPHLTLAGVPTTGSFHVFIPDAAILQVWGASSDAVLASGALSAAVTESGIVQQSTFTITRAVGGIRFDITGMHYSAPRVTISPKRLARRPATTKVTAGHRRATVTMSRVKGAKSYQAMCWSASSSVWGKSKTRTVIVRNLTKGPWTCEGRAVDVTAGRWSKARRISVR